MVSFLIKNKQKQQQLHSHSGGCDSVKAHSLIQAKLYDNTVKQNNTDTTAQPLKSAYFILIKLSCCRHVAPNEL